MFISEAAVRVMKQVTARPCGPSSPVLPGSIVVAGIEEPLLLPMKQTWAKNRIRNPREPPHCRGVRQLSLKGPCSLPTASVSFRVQR